MGFGSVFLLCKKTLGVCRFQYFPRFVFLKNLSVMLPRQPSNKNTSTPVFLLAKGACCDQTTPVKSTGRFNIGGGERVVLAPKSNAFPVVPYFYWDFSLFEGVLPAPPPAPLPAPPPCPNLEPFPASLVQGSLHDLKSCKVC